MKSKKIVFAFLGSLIVLFSLSVVFARAAEFRVAKEGQNINVSKDESVKNLYTAGNIVSIDGEVKNDLYTAGNVITIESDVENNFAGAGGTITIKGDVGNNVHVAGGTVIVQGEIAEDLFIAGGNVLLAKTATVKGDLIVGGGTVDIEGPVVGNVSIGGGKVTINNKMEGQVKIMVDSLTIGETAEIAKDIKYTSPKKAQIHKDAKILGKVDFNQREINKVDKSSVASGIFGALVTLLLFDIITCVVVGLALVYIFNKLVKSVVIESLKNVWGNMGVGFAVLFLAPIIGIILAITVVGLYLAGLFFLLYALLLTLSLIIASIVLGSLLLKILKKEKDYEVGWQEVVVGVVVMKIVWFIPLIGWLLCAVFTLVSIGAVSRLAYGSIKKNK